MSTTNRFILQNLALRAMGLTKIPPYWLFRENNFHGVNLGYLSAAKTIPESSGFDVDKMTDEELADVVRTNARESPWCCLSAFSWRNPVRRNGFSLRNR
ncbi:MAG: hypothetical protein ACLRYB_14905 [Segatella copri]